MSEDYYKVLGIQKDADDSKIKKSYRKLAMQWHPDRHANESDKKQKDAEDKFKKINEAYEVLSDPEKRKQYDIFGSNAFKGGNGGNSFHGFSNPQDIFAQFFGNSGFGNSGFGNSGFGNGMGHRVNINGMDIDLGSMGFGGNRNKRRATHSNGYNEPEKKKGKDYEYLMEFALEELYHGKDKKIRINRKGSSNGMSYDEAKMFDVKVMPGWKDGTKLTFSNEGDRNPGMIPGDIIVIIKEKPHDRFTRTGNDLEIMVDITLDEALHGFQRQIKCIDGTVHNLTQEKIPESQYVHTVPRKGMPVRSKGRVIGIGDMVIRFNVAFQ